MCLSMLDMYSAYRLQAVASSRCKVLDVVGNKLGAFLGPSGHGCALGEGGLRSLLGMALPPWGTLLCTAGTPGTASAVLRSHNLGAGSSCGAGTGVAPGACAGRSLLGRSAAPLASGGSGVGHLQWVLAGPSRGGFLSRLHLVRAGGDGRTCCGKMLRSPAGVGYGLQSAEATGAEWSPRCRSHLRQYE